MSCRESRSRKDKDEENFFEDVADKMESIVKTHSVIFNLFPKSLSKEESRRRHHYKKAFPMMVAGFMMMSAFMVPLGFQFMAMLGGKALLLSKMAFMMTMYQNYKRYYNDVEFHHQFDPNHELVHFPLHRSTEMTGPAAMTGAFARPRPDLIYKLKKG